MQAWMKRTAMAAALAAAACGYGVRAMAVEPEPAPAPTKLEVSAIKLRVLETKILAAGLCGQNATQKQKDMADQIQSSLDRVFSILEDILQNEAR